MNKVLKKVINIIIDIIVVFILLISLLVVILSVTSKSAGVPNIFGVAPMAVETDSMKDTINEGDLIFSKLTDGKNRAERKRHRSLFSKHSGRTKTEHAPYY